MFKKLLLSIFLSIFLLVSLSTPYAYAQTTNPWYSQSFQEWYIKVYDTNVSPPNEIFGERYTAAQVQWIIYSLIAVMTNIDGKQQRITCLMSGGDIGGCLQQYPILAYSAPINTPNRSVFATLFPKERDLSGVGYVREKLTHSNIVPEAKAQGFGFGALSPVRGIWRVFRDITYGLFVIFIIILAFMIMFRYKINPQTVVTVQSAIPKIIIGLILVTFSYAIAGFLVDLLYVVIGLVALAFSNTGGLFAGNWQGLFDLLTNGPVIGGFSTGVFGWMALYLILLFLGLVAAAYGLTGLGAVGILSGVVLTVVGLLFVVGFLIWAFIAAVKVIFLLIKTYLQILLLVIFAPIYIGAGVVYPGLSFGSWLRSLISNLAIYPIIGILFMLSLVFLSASYAGLRNEIGPSFGITIQSPFDCPGQTSCPSWYPPLTVGSQSGNFDPLPILWLAASLSAIALVPKAGDIIQSLLSERPFGYGAAIGEAAGGVAGIGGAAGAATVWRPLTAYRETRALRQEAERKAAVEELTEKYRAARQARGVRNPNP